MKRILFFSILVIISFSRFAAQIEAQAAAPVNSGWESYEVVSRLLSIQKAEAPIVYNDTVIFTADSNHRRVGVAFAHEDFSTVYWFTRLIVPQDSMAPVILPGQRFPAPFKDAEIQFYVYQIPEHLLELEYRLIVNGLWTIDPSNPQSRRDMVSGLQVSVLSLPPRPITHHPLKGLPEGLSFSFDGPPGETVTVAGSFNGWDPFMFELKEGPAGTYNLTIPLPPGTYQYVFFHRGERFTDPHNPRRIYARDGSAASEVVIP